MSRETDDGRILRLISKSLPIFPLVVTVGFFGRSTECGFYSFPVKHPEWAFSEPFHTV